jgi:hypothetical protein
MESVIVRQFCDELRAVESIIPALGKLRQKDCEFEVNLGCV